MSVKVNLPSIFDVSPLETGGVEAREGFFFQDHVAASYCLRMLETSEIQQVWCEAQDDITLIRDGASGVWVEFVQVKSNELDQLWSIALLCRKKKTSGSSSSQPSASPVEKLSILEKSLSNDRIIEDSVFRIVTSRDVKEELSILKLELGHPERDPAGTLFSQLKNSMPVSVTGLVSDRGRNYEDWLKSVVWEVLGNVSNLQDRNHVLLDRLMESESHYLSPDQRVRVYDKLLVWVQNAALAHPTQNRSEKRIARDDLVRWINLVAQEVLHPASAGKTDALKHKMLQAGLPSSAVESAVEQRRSYLTKYRSRAFLDLSTMNLAADEVRSKLVRLTSKLNSGKLVVSGVDFHDLCLEELENLGLYFNASHASNKPVPTSFLDGCMYDMTNRCLHKFTRETA